MPFVDSKVLTRVIEKQSLKTNDLQGQQHTCVIKSCALLKLSFDSFELESLSLP
jgi:hypothetical protein